MISKEQQKEYDTSQLLIRKAGGKPEYQVYAVNKRVNGFLPIKGEVYKLNDLTRALEILGLMNGLKMDVQLDRTVFGQDRIDLEKIADSYRS